MVGCGEVEHNFQLTVRRRSRKSAATKPDVTPHKDRRINYGACV